MMLLLALPVLAQNRLKNGGMEDLTAASQFQLAATTGDWWLNPSYPARVTAIEDPRIAHSGKLCIRVVPFDRTVGEGGQAPREGAVSQGVGQLEPGDTYFIRFFARGLGTVTAPVYEYDKNGFKGSHGPPTQQLSSNWREYRWYYTVPEGVTAGQLAFHVPPGGLMYLDDVSFAPIAAFPTPPAITEVDVNGDGKPEFVMENPALRLAIDPRRGAQVVSVLRKSDNQELIPDQAKSGGLFSDHDVSQPYPGELMNVPYTAAKVDLQDGSAAIKFTYTTAEKGTQMSGLRLEKTVSLFPDAPAIRCDVAFTNPTKEGRAVQYWMQNFVTASGNPAEDTFVRPASTGISRLSPDAVQPEFVHDPVAGWTAVSSGKGSVAFTMDYDNLDTLYNCGPCKPGATTEWMLSKVAVPAGKTWQTTVWCLLTKIQDPVFVSPDVVAGARHKLEGGTTLFTNSFTAATRPLGKLEEARRLIRVTMRYDTPTGKTVPVETAQVVGGGWGPRSSFDLPAWTPATDTGGGVVFTDGLWLLRINLTSDALTAQYDLPVRVGVAAPEYQTTPPPKLVIRFQPEELAIDRSGKLRVLLIQNEFVKPIVQRWKLQEILQGLPGPPEVTVSQHSYIDWKMAGQLTFFPALMEDLLKYQVVILETPDAAAFSPSEQEMLRDYVKAGGGMLVLGGYYSYGKGRWEGTTLGGMMPVKTKGAWDLVEVKAALQPAAPHAALNGVDLGAEPRVAWAHDVDPVPGAQVLLTVGGKPLLVANGAGPGKVLCFTGTILGYEDKVGGMPFWKWDKYPAFLQSLISWLGSEQ